MGMLHGKPLYTSFLISPDLAPELAPTQSSPRPKVKRICRYCVAVDVQRFQHHAKPCLCLLISKATQDSAYANIDYKRVAMKWNWFIYKFCVSPLHMRAASTWCFGEILQINQFFRWLWHMLPHGVLSCGLYVVLEIALTFTPGCSTAFRIFLD